MWEWRDGRIEVLVLRDAAYTTVEPSELLVDLDLDLVARLIERDDQTQAVRDLRAALRRAQ